MLFIILVISGFKFPTVSYEIKRKKQYSQNFSLKFFFRSSERSINVRMYYRADKSLLSKIIYLCSPLRKTNVLESIFLSYQFSRSQLRCFP